jgi:endonuclease YncB( thermonuclease family)
MNQLKNTCIVLFLIAISAIGYSQSYNGIIIRIIDGDTFVFQTEEGSLTIRMYGTDAPERDQQYSEESAGFLKLYLNKDATLKARGVDRYGRTLGVLIIEKQDINLLSIKGGYSWHFKRYSSDKQYAEAEEYAKKNKLGLWNMQNPIPPWEWRNN